MIGFPNAKINLGLHITVKRSDGFHDIETVFYPLKLSDILEILPIEKPENHSFSYLFKSSGIKIPGNPEENLCIKAWSVMQEKFSLPLSAIHLHKLIPPGSGLGGGSSDATHVIKLLDRLYKLNLTPGQLMQIASEIGSDCAFFVQNEAVLAYGKGDRFKKTEINLRGYFLRLVLPGTGVSTKLAYSKTTPKKPSQNLENIIGLTVDKWKNHLVNDFEEPIFSIYPELKRIKDQLYESGAVYASMSGSGSSIYGIYRNPPPPEYFFTNSLVWDEKL
jgi:4-diphosphocytidyl-2-C-methyl-D-erythritol kinase